MDILYRRIYQQATQGSTKAITKAKIVMSEKTISDINDVDHLPK